MMNALKSDYKFIKAGTIDGGLNFEDFLAQDSNKISAVRCYFSGEKIVKISFASYGRNEHGEIFGKKCIVKILEFTNSPNENLLRLPAGLADVTKR
jgi:hypothetical protein